MRSGWKDLRTIFVILAGAIALAACGGGGGGGSDSGSGYTGNTQAAVIDADNAEEIALSAYEAGESQSGMDISLPFAGMGSLSLAETLSASLASQDFSQSASAAAMQSEKIPGDCGGEMVLSISGTENSFSGSINYDNYCSVDITTNGSMTFSGSYKEATEALSFTMKFNSLTMTMGDESFTSNGSISMMMNMDIYGDTYGPMTYEMTMNSDTAAGEVSWVSRLEGYKMTVAPGSGYDLVTVTGKYYYGDVGYVTISTDQDLQISDADDYPQSGTIHFEGADETWATLTFTGGGGYQIDGSGLASPVTGNFNLSGTGGSGF